MIGRNGDGVRCATTGYGYGIAGAVAMGAAQSSHDSCVRDLQKLGYVKLPEAFLGITVQPKIMPAAITEVAGPAEQVGLLQGDILTEVDGKRVNDPFVLFQVMSKKKAGDEVPLKINRSGAPMDFKIIAIAR